MGYEENAYGSSRSDRCRSSDMGRMGHTDMNEPITGAERRIILRDVVGNIMTDVPAMDITNIENADSRATIIIEVQQLCDMLHWHTLNHYTTVPWGP
jgi:hypothetical protein